MKTILLVEDTGPMRRAIARRLACYDTQVSQASSATAAMEALKRRNFDVILTDYDLGEGARNGVWLLGQIPSPDRVVKCLTSALPKSMIPEEIGRYHFFPKPLNLKLFAYVAGLKKEEA